MRMIGGDYFPDDPVETTKIIPVVTGIAKQDSPKLTNGQDLTEDSITFMTARSAGLVKQMLKDKMATEIFKGLIQQGIV